MEIISYNWMQTNDYKENFGTTIKKMYGNIDNLFTITIWTFIKKSNIWIKQPISSSYAVMLIKNFYKWIKF